MKRAFAFILPLFVALFATAALAQDIGGGVGRVQRGGFLTQRAFQTYGALTLYVDSTGNDANACTSSGTDACLTIQGAINKIPKFVRHLVTINVGAGTFAGAYITGFTIEAGNLDPTNGARIKVVGTRATAVGLGGSMSGTATGGTAGSGSTWGTLVDAGAGWTVNALQGYEIEIAGGTGSGQYKQIASNTATTITIPGTFSPAPDATSTYAIRDWSTNCNTSLTLPATAFASSAATGGCFLVDAVQAGSQVAFELQHFHLNPTNTRGVRLYSPTGGLIKHVKCSTGSQNCITALNGGTAIAIDSTKGSGNGVLASQVNSGAGNVTVQNSTVFGSYGLLFAASGNAFSDSSNFSYNITGTAYETGAAINGLISNSKVDCVTPGASKRGVNYGVSSSTTFGVGGIALSGVDISNCGEGVKVREGFLAFTGTVTGTGNTTGMNVLEGGGLKIATTTTLTGTTEISIDGTATTLALVRAQSPKRNFSPLFSIVWEP